MRQWDTPVYPARGISDRSIRIRNFVLCLSSQHFESLIFIFRYNACYGLKEYKIDVRMASIARSCAASINGFGYRLHTPHDFLVCHFVCCSFPKKKTNTNTNLFGCLNKSLSPVGMTKVCSGTMAANSISYHCRLIDRSWCTQLIALFMHCLAEHKTLAMTMAWMPMPLLPIIYKCYINTRDHIHVCRLSLSGTGRVLKTESSFFSSFTVVYIWVCVCMRVCNMHCVLLKISKIFSPIRLAVFGIMSLSVGLASVILLDLLLCIIILLRMNMAISFIMIRMSDWTLSYG